MGQCSLCKRTDRPVAEILGLCAECLKNRSQESMSYILRAHRHSRDAFSLPVVPPSESDGLVCGQCVNNCSIGQGQLGYCGVRENTGQRIEGVNQRKGKLSWYHDPLPTNCVADWVCPGGTGAGFPEYALKKDGPEIGCKNLAVFFHSCTFNCLYCQNWHFREETLRGRYRSVEELIEAVDEKTTCICYFGGDPSSQMPFAIRASEEILKRKKHRPLRICWETNGSMDRALLKRAVDLSLLSGGIIKFDLKAWTETVHVALTGVTNRRTLENFSFVAERIHERPEVPLLVASTLLVPGYVEVEEVRQIARFIASLNRDIPYSLLAFYPHFYMSDLPLVNRDTAERCKEAALEEGLRNVRIGNIHLLR